MEGNDRIAQVRKAAGLTQEQLGEMVGVTRQAVSKWEAGQTVPDALTVARLCEVLHVSADYVLLGREPSGQTESAPAYEPPETCPCCGRYVTGSLCPVCGYVLPTTPPRGGRYAILLRKATFAEIKEQPEDIYKYTGADKELVREFLVRSQGYNSQYVLRRDLTDSAVVWITSHLQSTDLDLTIVEDCGEDEDALLVKEKAMELPDPVRKKDEGGIGFFGVVGAVIVALLILALF